MGKPEVKYCYPDSCLRIPGHHSSQYPLGPCHSLQEQSTESDVTPRLRTWQYLLGPCNPLQGQTTRLIDVFTRYHCQSHLTLRCCTLTMCPCAALQCVSFHTKSQDWALGVKTRRLRYRATAGLLGTPCGVDWEHPIVGAPSLIGTKWSSFVTTNFGVNVDIALSIASSQRFLQQSPAEVLMVCVVCRCDIVSRHPKALHAAVPSEAVPLPTGADHRDR